MDTKEELLLIFLLIDIIEKKSTDELLKFISYCSRYIDTKNFEDILRIVRKILNNKYCGNEYCNEWLQVSLLKIYDRGFN